MMHPFQGVPEVVELNVGGKIYTTSLTTLLKDPESLLAAIFSGRQGILRDSHGRVFIDRDGRLFRYIIDYLREFRLVLPKDFKEHTGLLAEAEYYRINELVKALKQQRRQTGYLSLSVRSNYSFRNGIAYNVTFRKLQHILICGDTTLAREVFGESLNETRNPDKMGTGYSNRFFLKHIYLEGAFDLLNQCGFHLVTSCAGGAGYDSVSEDTKWNHFNDYVFYRT